MSKSPKIEALRDTLQAKKDEILVELGPLRAEWDSPKITRARRDEVRPLIKALQAKLAPIENELGCCARALGGKSLKAGA